MTRVLICTQDVTPCPAEAQQWASFGEAFDYADLGISAGAITSVFAWGFGAVVLLWFFGYCIAVPLKLIRKI